MHCTSTETVAYQPKLLNPRAQSHAGAVFVECYTEDLHSIFSEVIHKDFGPSVLFVLRKISCARAREAIFPPCLFNPVDVQVLRDEELGLVIFLFALLPNTIFSFKTFR